MAIRIIRNPDEEYAAEVTKKIKANDGHCPCALIKSADTKCRCKAFRDQVARGEAGECHCGLWIAYDPIKEESDLLIKQNERIGKNALSGTALQRGTKT